MSIVYAARNLAMPGLIKIGKTSRKADARLSQLYTSGVPVPFKYVIAVETERSAAEVEQALHRAFEPHRLNPAREFFEVEPEHVVAILRLLGEDVTDQMQAADDRDGELTAGSDDRERDGRSSCRCSIEQQPDGRLEVRIDGRVAFHMPDVRNPVEAIRRSAQHLADTVGVSKWNTTVEVRDDQGDPYAIDYETLHVLAAHVDDLLR